MSEPQRYTLALPDISYGMDESNKGEYVLWRDYARLKAEVERLGAFRTHTIIPNEILKAEVERLTNENAFLKLEVERLKNNCEYIDKLCVTKDDKTGQL